MIIQADVDNLNAFLVHEAHIGKASAYVYACNLVFKQASLPSQISKKTLTDDLFLIKEISMSLEESNFVLEALKSKHSKTGQVIGRLTF